MMRDIRDYGIRTRHERDQSFLTPAPAKKKSWSRSRSRCRRKKILVPVPAGKSFRSWSLQKQILVPVSVKNIFVTVPVQKKHFGPGPVQKKFWCWSQSKKILVPVPIPVKKRNLVPGPGPLCSSLIRTVPNAKLSIQLFRDCFVINLRMLWNSFCGSHHHRKSQRMMNQLIRKHKTLLGIWLEFSENK